MGTTTVAAALTRAAAQGLERLDAQWLLAHQIGRVQPHILHLHLGTMAHIAALGQNRLQRLVA